MKREHGEPVVFRKWGDGTIIALFPDIPTENTGTFVSSYEHMGQHSSADYGAVISRTKPAKPAEYKELKEELEEIGYSLRVMQRRTG